MSIHQNLLNFLLRDDKVAILGIDMPLEENPLTLRDLIEEANFMDEERYGGTNWGNLEGGLLIGGVK